MPGGADRVCHAGEQDEQVAADAARLGAGVARVRQRHHGRAWRAQHPRWPPQACGPAAQLRRGAARQFSLPPSAERSALTAPNRARDLRASNTSRRLLEAGQRGRGRTRDAEQDGRQLVRRERLAQQHARQRVREQRRRGRQDGVGRHRGRRQAVVEAQLRRKPQGRHLPGAVCQSGRPRRSTPRERLAGPGERTTAAARRVCFADRRAAGAAAALGAVGASLAPAESTSTKLSSSLWALGATQTGSVPLASLPTCLLGRPERRR